MIRIVTPLLFVVVIIACSPKSQTESSQLVAEDTVKSVPSLAANEKLVTLGSIETVEGTQMVGFRDEAGNDIFFYYWDVDLDKTIIQPYFNVITMEGVPFDRYELKPEFKSTQFVITTSTKKIQTEEGETDATVLTALRKY